MFVVGDNCPPVFASNYGQSLIACYTASHSIFALDTGNIVHTNLGATDVVTLALPQSVPAGFTVQVVVMAAFELRIAPGAAGAIYINGAKQTDNKYVSATVINDCATFTADGNGDWVATGVSGTWTVEGA